jgi:alpha,alpha-trehalase
MHVGRRWHSGLLGTAFTAVSVSALTAMLSALAWTTASAGRPQAHSAGHAAPAPEQPLEPPQILFGELFVAVQSSGLFKDGKAFVDATPNESPTRILADYHAVHPDSPQALLAFVESHFRLPVAAEAAASAPEQVPIATHIDRLWSQLTRRSNSAPAYSSLLPLPQPYVVPGGRFREIYYWDSYFTMLGLKESGRQDLLDDMVRDFAYLIDTYGHVPNGARTYYLSRSQPPFFFEMVGLLEPEDPAAAFERYLPQLEREYAFWMEGAGGLKPGTAHRRVVAMSDGAILNRYWDDRDTPRDEAYREDVQLARQSGRSLQQVYRDIRAAAESGWDFGSRWFADGHTPASIDTTEIVPIDLNSLLYGLENAIRSGCARRSDQPCERAFARHARARLAAVNRHLWSAPARAYLDYHWPDRQPITRVSAAELYPLFTHMASEDQAAEVAQGIIRELLRSGGVVTTPLQTGEQWDAPNGWAPLQWIAVSGLRQYGQQGLATTIACRWIGNVQGVYDQSGKLVEKYDVLAPGRGGGGGEYPTQDGFGWTNGVMRKLLSLYPPERCPQT